MVMQIREFQMYKNFNELVTDILELVKVEFNDRPLFLSGLSDKHQMMLKLAEVNQSIQFIDGEITPLNATVCHSRINFYRGIPLVYGDISKKPCLSDIRETISKANINSYMGVPIILKNGEVFGTLCVVYENAKEVSEKSIAMLVRVAKMLSYYLDLECMAYRDHLTGIYNRHFIYQYYQEFPTNDGSILFVDLDGFKNINDKYGHDTGDLVLKEVASRIETIIMEMRIEGFGVRLGGDEFVITLIGKYNDCQLEELAMYILHRLSSWENQLKEYHLSASIGIVSFSRPMKERLNELLKQADNAMYRAKAEGKNTYSF